MREVTHCPGLPPPQQLGLYSGASVDARCTPTGGSCHMGRGSAEQGFCSLGPWNLRSPAVGTALCLLTRKSPFGEQKPLTSRWTWVLWGRCSPSWPSVLGTSTAQLERGSELHRPTGASKRLSGHCLCRAVEIRARLHPGQSDRRTMLDGPPS